MFRISVSQSLETDKNYPYIQKVIDEHYED